MPTAIEGRIKATDERVREVAAIALETMGARAFL